MNTLNITPIQNSLRNRIKSIFTKVPQTAYSVASLAAFAAINYTIIHSPIVLILCAVLMVHELAHYFYAKAYGSDPSPPFILPIPFVALAFVKVQDLLDQYKSHVALSGMVFGSLTIFILSLFNYFIPMISFYALFVMFSFEIIFNIIGSDGSKYRRYKEKIYNV